MMVNLCETDSDGVGEETLPDDLTWAAIVFFPKGKGGVLGN